jgi:tetratricopeptide (TPR) repeat protein
MWRQHEAVLCVGFGLNGWSSLGTTERIQARVSLTDTVNLACRRLGLPETETAIHSGERLIFVLRGEPVSTASGLIGMLIRGESVIGGTRIVMTSGQAGSVSTAHTVVESLRLLDRGPAERSAPLTVVLSDLLYRYVLAGGAARRLVPAFQRVSGRGFGPDSWVWPSPPGPAARQPAARQEATPAARGPADSLLPWLGWRVRRLIRRGDLAEAIFLLRKMLRIKALPSLLLMLGECHLELGERRAAIEVWRYLIRRRPLTAQAYLLVGALEERDDIACAYLGEGVKIVQTYPDLSAAPHALMHDLLLELADRSYRQNDQSAGDRFVNAAAEARPDSAKPLLVLAHEATRRGDRATASWLLKAALARTAAEHGELLTKDSPVRSTRNRR